MDTDSDSPEAITEVDVEEAETIYFREVQHISRLWLVVVLAGVLVAALSPALDLVTDFEAAVFITVSVLTGVFLYSIRLTTEVRDDGVYVRLFPLHRSFRRFGFDETDGFDSDEYSLLEYGGWGLRWSVFGRGKAYTTKGRQGVRIDLKDRGGVFIGSQSPDDLVSAVETAQTGRDQTT
ncbi:DUF6141 family protein [Halorutilales archaeon Cl-col2-1]